MLVCAVVGGSAATASAAGSDTGQTAPTGASAVRLANRQGVYTQPGPKGRIGADRFAAWSGVPVTQVLDFTPTSTWKQISEPTWMLDAYAGMDARLELSLPMLSDEPGTNLAACAAGEYDQYWTTLAGHMVTRGLQDTVVRPGWEFNGTWYRWSAAGKAESYAGCFRSIVTAMRKVPGQQFLFDWNVAGGPGAFPAEQAYPGDDYVDVIGVDVYDYSWGYYPVATPDDPAAVDLAQYRTWRYLYAGDHGLAFWSDYARTHGKPMALTEWGVAWRPDGHGGNDDPAFIDHIADFMEDPANNVAYGDYFEIDVPTVAHSLSSETTRFPRSAARYKARFGAMPPPPLQTGTSSTTTTAPKTAATVTATATATGTSTAKATVKASKSARITVKSPAKATATATATATASVSATASATATSTGTGTTAAAAKIKATANATAAARAKATANATAAAKAKATANATAAAETKATAAAKAKAIAAAKAKAKAGSR